IVVALNAASQTGSAAAPRPTPVLVELFTSEGCSSCPPADALLQTLVNTQSIAGAEVIALGHHVDYWDRLGWRDRFSSGASTNRQQRYAQVFNIDAVYTPQLVVDGRDQFVGSDANAARRTIGRAAAGPHATVAIALGPADAGRVTATVTIAELPKISRGDKADLVVAITESGLRSDVRGGENRGRQLAHAPVVRQLTTIGEISADAALQSNLAIAPAWQRERVMVVAFVQERFSRQVLGAAASPLQSDRR